MLSGVGISLLSSFGLLTILHLGSQRAGFALSTTGQLADLVAAFKKDWKVSFK